MTLNDLWLLSPELSLVSVAAVLILIDLVTQRKGLLPVLAILGLTLSLGFSVALWFDLEPHNGISSMQGIFGTLSIDRFSLFFKVLFLSIAILVVIASVEYMKKSRRLQAEYYALIMFSTSGMMLLASTSELITIYVALELTALPLAAIVAFNRDSRSAEAGMKFLILSAISSAILLYGMVMVYGFTGSTMIQDIAEQLNRANLNPETPFGSYALLFGIVLIIAGFGFKIASVPFQMWAPDVYEGAPTPITAFLSTASKAAGFAVILRVFYIAFPNEIFSLDWSATFAVLSVLSMTIGNLVAIRQENIKRLLAYSTVAHAGYLMMGLAAIVARSSGSELNVGPSSVLFYLAGYAFTNLAAFTTVIAISNQIKSDMIDDFAGMARRAPYLAAVLTFSMISLIGLPPTVGFITKVYIFGGAVNANLGWLALAGVLNSVISAYYYLRVVKVMYISPPKTEKIITSGRPIQLAILVSFIGVAFFGLYPTPLLSIARKAAEIFII